MNYSPYVLVPRFSSLLSIISCVCLLLVVAENVVEHGKHPDLAAMYFKTPLAIAVWKPKNKSYS